RPSIDTLRNSVVVTKGISSHKVKELASKQYSQLRVDALFTLPHVPHILSDRSNFLPPHPSPLLSCADSHSPSSPLPSPYSYSTARHPFTPQHHPLIPPTSPSRSPYSPASPGSPSP